MDRTGFFPSSIVLISLTVDLFTQVQTVVNCNNSFKNPQHCEFRPGGVHHLDCFRRLGVTGIKIWTCEWQPGIGASRNTYTLSMQHGSLCNTMSNITGLSKTIEINNKKDTTDITALVLENSDSQNCTKSIFKGTPKDLLRCGPPLSSSFSRHSGLLNVGVGWPPRERKYIKKTIIRYKAMGDLHWNVTETYQNGCMRHSLNPGQVYVVQAKCAQSDKCSQCPWSVPHVVPAELKTQPVLVNLEGVDCPITKGSRLVSLAWKTTEEERPDGYFVSIQKASGELPKNNFSITRTEMTLNLSCSAYIVTITAFNNVSVSPALSQTITSGGRRATDAGKLNVTLHSNASFTVYWEAQLLKSYVCYSVELNRKQLKATYFSFFEDEQNNKTLDLTEPLEPYKRYTLFLHIRRNKDTCNLKSINSSERTYGRMHFYFEEGSPMSAPTNLSYYNLTATSLVLQWSPIPEEDLRGFLLGYKIDYQEYNSGSHTAEKTVIIDAESTSHVIEGLKPGTGYQVQISGYTRAGRGVLSIPGQFKTYEQVHEKNNMTILVFVATIALLTVACTLIKRTKVVFWPSIPNPENSNAIKNIERFCEVELLESLQTLKIEERDSHSVKIVKEAAGHLSWPILFAAENQEDSTEMCSEQIQEDTNKHNILDSPAHTELAGHANSHPAFTCGYTTLEMFQDAEKSHCSQIISNGPRGKLQDDVIALKPGQHYVGQFCSSLTFDMSTKG